MYEQHRISTALAGGAALIQIRKLVAEAGHASRTEIGRRVCALFEFVDARGKPQVASCVRARRTLEAAR